MTDRTVRLHRVLRASPQKVYRAFTEARATLADLQQVRASLQASLPGSICFVSLAGSQAPGKARTPFGAPATDASASAAFLSAVLAGHSVLFRSAAALLEELHRQTPEGRHRKLRTYANVGLLCVDEVGYLSFDDKSADLLYEVINRRYERKSVILTTNRPFKEWNEVFPNAACIVTLLDRLLHHADVTLIEGDSYRVRESEQETAARRRKK